MTIKFRPDYPTSMPLCPTCGDYHLQMIGYDTSVHGRVDLVFHCLGCVAVSKMYVVNDGTLVCMGWNDNEELRRKRRFRLAGVGG